MDFVKRIGRYIPAHIKGHLCQNLDTKLVLDKKLIEDLIEFYNMRFGYSEAKMSYNEAIHLSKVAWRVNADFWGILDPKNEDDIIKFYNIVPYYPFELAHWHMFIGQRRFRKEVVNYSFGDVLDYGGGIGDLCIELARKGLNVTYGDVRGINYEFAEWLFKKRSYMIRMIDLGKGLPNDEEFDTIICIDTIEHVINPELVLEKIVENLKFNGKLIITALNCSGRKEENPMHLRMNFDAEELLNSFGVFKSDIYDWLWIKKSKV